MTFDFHKQEIKLFQKRKDGIKILQNAEKNFEFFAVV